MFNVILFSCPSPHSPFSSFFVSRVLGNPMDIVRREVCVQGNWKMLSGEEERDSGVFVGGRRLGHAYIVCGGTVSKLGTLVCVLCFLFLNL